MNYEKDQLIKYAEVLANSFSGKLKFEGDKPCDTCRFLDTSKVTGNEYCLIGRCISTADRKNECPGGYEPGRVTGY